MKTRDFLIQKSGFQEFEKTDRYAYAGASANAIIRHGNYADYIWSEDLAPINSVQAILNFRYGNKLTQCYFTINAAQFVNWDALIAYVDDTVYEGLKRANTLKEAENYVKGVLDCLGYKLNF